MNIYDVGDWVRYKGVTCRVIGHWHDKQWVDHLVLCVPENAGMLRKAKQVTSWRFVGTALPETVEPIEEMSQLERIDER